MIEIEIIMDGTAPGATPILIHNVDVLAHPTHPLPKELKEITDKKKKTDADYEAMARIAWYGALYTAPGISGPAMKTANIRKCLIDAGMITRRGKQVGRAILPTKLYVPIEYEGPKSLDEIFRMPEFMHQEMVRVKSSRVLRTRPKFASWKIRTPCKLLDNVLNLKELEHIVHEAGLAVGLGDNRTNGWGRFTGTVRVL